MKNLTKLTLVSASLMLAGNAFATKGDDDDRDAISVVGHVAPICQIVIPQPVKVDFQHDLVAGESRGGRIPIICNSKAGATVELRSGDGLSLKGDDSDDHVVNYKANWTVSTADLNVDTAGAKVATDTIPGSKELAMGMVTGSFDVELTDTAKFAGDYSDVVTLYIAAN